MIHGPRLRLKDLPPEVRKAAREQKRKAVEAERREFVTHCRVCGLPKPTPEYAFHPDRGWRFDWAWPDRMVALEIEGGAFVRGRHTRGAGFEADLEKYSEAAALGWRIVRVLPKQLYDGRTVLWLRRALEIR